MERVVELGRKNQHQQRPRHPRSWEVPQGTTALHKLSPGPISTQTKSCWRNPMCLSLPSSPCGEHTRTFRVWEQSSPLQHSFSEGCNAHF